MDENNINNYEELEPEPTPEVKAYDSKENEDAVVVDVVRKGVHEDPIIDYSAVDYHGEVNGNVSMNDYKEYINEEIGRQR